MLEPLGAITSGSQFLEPNGNAYASCLYITYLHKSQVIGAILTVRKNVFDFHFFNFSGMFPNHIPNPEDKTAMEAITQAVLENKADLGIIFDTDVDRW